MSEIIFKDRCFNNFHPSVLKQIANAIEEKVPDDCQFKSNKRHNENFLLGGTKYFVVYEFIENERILVMEVKRVK